MGVMRYYGLLCLALLPVFAMAAKQPAPPPVQPHAQGVATPVVVPEGFVSWDLLKKVETKLEKGRYVPVFDPAIQALSQQPEVKLAGYMMPLDMQDNQKRFVLSSTPPNCPFCPPGGPDSLIYVEAAKPVKFTYDVVQISGRFQALPKDPNGLLYKVTAAKSIQ